MLGLRCCVRAFSSCAGSGYSSLWCVGFSLRWLLFSQSRGSRCTGFSSCGTWASSCGSRALEHRLSSCGPWALEHRLSSCGARSSHCGGFSFHRAGALGTRVSVVVARGPVVVARGLWSTGSVVVAHGLGCSAACGIFPDQGSNPCPLHWQADS